jgi:S1-C subfamily serine protease
VKLTNLQVLSSKDWIPESVARFLREYPKEIAIAFGLAILAAIVIDPIYSYRASRSKQQALQGNLKAVATVQALDSNGKSLAQGSGFFVTPNGVLVTNFHVIKGADRVIAHLPSGAFYLLRGIKGVDEKADFAILQFDARETPSVKGFADSDLLRTGDHVFTLGTPEGLEATYSTGVISNPARQVDGQSLIQFSAPISSGSSGGGLFNDNGEVVGITTASEGVLGSQAGFTQNLNFAVPIDRVKNTLNSANSVELQKDSPGYYYSLANLADNKRLWAKAIQLYTEALNLDPDYGDAYKGLAGDYYERGNYELEVSNYEKAAALGPENADTWYFLGSAYEDIGNYEKAITAYNKALAIYPDHKDALHDLAIVYISTGDTQNASRLLRRLMAVDKGWGNQIQLLIKRVEH